MDLVQSSRTESGQPPTHRSEIDESRDALVWRVVHLMSRLSVSLFSAPFTQREEQADEAWKIVRVAKALPERALRERPGAAV